MAIITNKLGSNIVGVILLGSGGSGKGTQAQMMLNGYKGSHISVGDEVRERLESDPDFKENFQITVTNAGLLNDDVVLDLVKTKAATLEQEGIILIDGFCRTRPQADKIDEIFRYPSNLLAVEFKVDLDTVMQRAAERGRFDDNKVRDRFMLWDKHRREVIRKLAAKGVRTEEVIASGTKDFVFDKFFTHVSNHVRILNNLTPSPVAHHPHNERGTGRVINIPAVIGRPEGQHPKHH